MEVLQKRLQKVRSSNQLIINWPLISPLMRIDLEIARFCINCEHVDMACRIPQKNDDILRRTVC